MIYMSEQNFQFLVSKKKKKKKKTGRVRPKQEINIPAHSSIKAVEGGT